MGNVRCVTAFIVCRGSFGDDGEYLPLRSSPTNVLCGVFILWWGWFGFNAGSTGSLSGGNDLVAAKSALNTAMASGGGTVASLLFSYVCVDHGSSPEPARRTIMTCL